MATEGQRQSSVGRVEESHDFETPEAINEVSIAFEDGSIEKFSLVVRTSQRNWIYAERCVGLEDEFTKEKIFSINREAIRQIESDCIHLFDQGVIHYGDCLMIDPGIILEETGLDTGHKVDR